MAIPITLPRVMMLLMGIARIAREDIRAETPVFAG
jgi:hypothetical protein